MDIVNWDSLKKGLLLRNTLENPEDLVLVAANTTYKKRGDLYQTYAVPASAFVGGSGPIAIQDNGTPISAAATILNFVGATSVSGDPNVTITIPTGPIIFKNTIPGAVNSSPGEKTSYIVQIPGKTIKEGSVVRIHYRSRMLSNPLTSNFVEPIIRIGTSASGATGVAVGYDRFENPSTATTVSQMTRTLIVSNDLKTYALDDKNFYTDDNTQRGIEAVLAIDWTITQYIKFNIDIPVGPGSAQGVFYLIEIF
jgi:hypothetical protein